MRVLVLAGLASLAVSAPALAQDHGAHAQPDAAPAMTGALGPYVMGREASGTAWQPDVSGHGGVMVHRGPWMFMHHLVLNGVYDRQDGPRGDDKAFVSGMAMAMAQRRLGEGTVQVRGMLSPDPLMGKEGYPLLLASGETANGVTPLIDRQHPHDLFMELSTSYSRPLGRSSSFFVYAGLPGEPAFGPPAFMHRLSITDSPEAPISHHWLDSTHITFGVLTLGLVLDDWKIEASRFRGREPDQHRYDIETGSLDSTAVRLAWNPTDRWSVQASFADVASPEQLEPDEDQTKWSASAIYTVPLASSGWWSTTAAWGRRSGHHAGDWLDAYVLESAMKLNEAWTLFGRAERTENDELLGAHGPAPAVAKASLGAVRDFWVGDRSKIGLGAVYARTFIPKGLEAAYGGDQGGGMLFVRFKRG